MLLANYIRSGLTWEDVQDAHEVMLIRQPESLRIGQGEEERTATPGRHGDRAVVMFGGLGADGGSHCCC